MTAQLENGYTRIANEIVEKLCRTKLAGYDSMVLWCIFRKLYGWNKKEDWIANSQIVEMTGLYKAHVSRSVNRLVEMKIVTKNGNKLSINKNTSSWLPKMVTPKIVTKNGNTVTKNGNKKLPKMVDTKENKDTIQKKAKYSSFEKLKEIDEDDVQRIADLYQCNKAFVYSCIDNMENWLNKFGHRGEWGKPYKDYLSALRDFVKKDAIKIKQENYDKRSSKSKIHFAEI